MYAFSRSLYPPSFPHSAPPQSKDSTFSSARARAIMNKTFTSGKIYRSKMNKEAVYAIITTAPCAHFHTFLSANITNRGCKREKTLSRLVKAKWRKITATTVARFAECYFVCVMCVLYLYDGNWGDAVPWYNSCLVRSFFPELVRQPHVHFIAQTTATTTRHPVWTIDKF